MAVVSKGTKISLAPSVKIPDGFTPPNYDDFSDYRYQMVEMVLDIPKATVENADPATTLLNIIQDGTVGIEKQVSDILTTDYDGVNNPNTIDFWVHLTRLISNQEPSDKTSDFYANAAVVYQATVRVYIKATTP